MLLKVHRTTMIGHGKLVLFLEDFCSANMAELTAQDLEGMLPEAYDVIFSNLKGEGKELSNFLLVTKLLQKINIEKLNLKVLDDVFASFVKELGKSIKFNPNEFKDIPVNDKRKQPIIFTYDGMDWSGKIIWEKWLNHKDGQVWTTYSLKLPNNGYLYHRNYEKVQQKYSYLQDHAHCELQNALSAALDFFDDDGIEVRIFYMTDRCRMNIKVQSVALRAWLQITFEYGYPKQSVHTGWYTKEKMKQLLQAKK